MLDPLAVDDVGGAAAKQHIVCALMQGPDSAYALGEKIGRTIYAPVKQLVVAFSPDNEMGFKRVVLVQVRDSYSLGFLTKEFAVDSGAGPEAMVAVYVPTNHLYLGDIIVCRPEQVRFPDISVEEGLRIFLTAGMALPSRIGRIEGDHRPA